MKKELLLLLFLSSVHYGWSQDTIHFKDGNTIVVNIKSENLDEVRYKKWDAPDGPVWKKKKADIQIIKRANRIAIKPDEIIDFASCSTNHSKTTSECVRGNNIVLQIDSLYLAGAKIVLNNGAGTVSMAGVYLPQYMESLPPCVQKQCIHKYYLNRFYSSCSAGVVEYAIQDGETYLLIGGDKDLPNVVKILSNIHAKLGNQRHVIWLHDFLKQYSEVNDNLFISDIEQLSHETDSILHHKQLKDETKGAWVAVGTTLSRLYYPKILYINDITQPQGAELFSTKQQTMLKKNSDKISFTYKKDSINISQGISANEETQLLAMQFASDEIKDRSWLTSVASAGVATARNIGAESHAQIWSSDESIRTKARMDFSAQMFALSMDLFFSSLNYSYRNINEYKILLTPLSDNILYSITNTFHQFIDNEGRNDIDRDYGREEFFVRWKESDSIIFVSGNNLPITLNPITKNDYLLDEYYKIKKETSFWNPKYLIPSIILTAFGGWLCYTSFTKSLSDENIFSWNFLKTLCGSEIVLTAPLGIYLLSQRKRTKKYGELNERSAKKLRDRAMTELHLPLK